MKISLIVLVLFNICTCKPFFMNKNPSFLIYDFCFCGIAIFDVIYKNFNSYESRWIQWEFYFVKYMQNKYAMLVELDDMQCILPVFEI